RWSVLREGVVPASALEQVSPTTIVFVCTGNTCRSPLAEVLCKKLLADKLGCAPDDLARHGYNVLSAGLSATPGGQAAKEAVAAARERGADLASHCSRPATAELITRADHVVCMTRGHLRALLGQFGQFGARLHLLCRDGGDLSDPIGCDQEVYRACA